MENIANLSAKLGTVPYKLVGNFKGFTQWNFFRYISNEDSAIPYIAKYIHRYKIRRKK